jgi:hypothetical protein
MRINEVMCKAQVSRQAPADIAGNDSSCGRRACRPPALCRNVGNGAGVALGQQELLRQPVGEILRPSATIDGGVQRMPHGVEQASAGASVERVGGHARVESRLEQDLVGIDVADTRKPRLIHKDRLDRLPPVRQCRSERRFIELRSERVGTEVLLGDERRGAVGHADMADATRIDVGQPRAGAELDQQPRRGRLLGIGWHRL